MAEGNIKTKELSGIELFRSDVATVLESTEEQPVKLSSQFAKEYKRVFNKKFKPEKYGFESKSLYSYFTHIPDIITFTKKDGKLAIVPKERNEVFPAHCSDKVVEDPRTCSSRRDDDDCQSFTETGAQEDQFQGVDLLRSHVMAMIEDSEDKRVDLSCFDTIYQEKYKTRFKLNAYKLKGKLTKILGRTMSDFMEIENFGNKTFMKFKESYQKKAKNSETPGCSERNVFDREHPLTNVNDCPNVIDKKEMSFSNPVPLPCIVVQSAPLDNPIDPLQGIKDFKSDIKTILKNVESKKVNLSQLPHLYKIQFNCNFDHRRYSGFARIKLCKLVQKDFMSDLIVIEKCGSKTFVELRDDYDDISVEIQDKNHPQPVVPNMSSGHTVKDELNQLSQNNVQVTIKPCQTKISKLNSSQTAGLSGIELFKSEVKEILLEEGGRFEVTKFNNLYKIKFNIRFTGKKYGIKQVKKLSSLLKLIPDVVALEFVGSIMYMHLCNYPMEVSQVKENKKMRQDSKENIQSSEDVDDASTMSTSYTLTDQLDQSKETKDIATLPKTKSTPSDVIILPSHEHPKKSEKKLWSKLVEDEMMMHSPSPFEDSFNATQSLKSLASHRLSRSTYMYRTPHEVNELAKRIIIECAEDEHYVSLDVVKAKICEVIGVRDLKELGYRNPDTDIPELKDLQRLHSKLDLYGRAYVMVHSIATLTELGQSMARLVDKKDFSDLKVGPLVKLPVVYDLFKAPSDDVVIQNITTMQVLKNLNKYLTEEDKWTSKVDLEKFIQFMCDEYGCTSGYELGVRMQSIGLGISVLKRAKKAQSERSKEVEQELVVDLEREFGRRCKKIKDDLLGASHGDERSLLQKLLGSSVTDVLTKVYDHCRFLFEHNHTIKKKDLLDVEMCLKSLLKNKTLREFFNLALHMGCKSVVSEILDECTTEIMETKEREKQEKERAANPPSKGKLTQEIKKWLNSAQDLKTSTLAHIEDSVTAPFRPHFPNFFAFGYGTFLEFLSEQPELNTIIEQRSPSLGNSGEFSRCQPRNVGFLDFIRQCGAQSTKDEVERTVCGFYRVKNIKDLGFGDYDNILAEIKRENQNHRPNVFYEAAILCKDVPHIDLTSPRTSPGSNIPAGKLGWKTINDALIALKSAPLLCDLHEWTQWAMVFEPCLGGLKTFIKSQTNDEIQALETSGNALLRIDTNTTPDRFCECVDKNDAPGASGTLVSLVIKYGGIKTTPLTLITNHMRPALSKLASDDQENDGLTCPKFVLRCLCRMPDSMCMALADKVFLEPLGFAVGITNTCKLLLSCCTNDFQRSRLHRLGLGLGKRELIKDFKSTMGGESDNRYNQKKVNVAEEKPVIAVKPFSMEKLVVDDKNTKEEETEDVEPSGNVKGKEVCTDTEEAQDSDEEETIISNPCKAIIETIRKEEFGIGVSLGEEEERLFQKQREREGRSLHRLSADLYNKDTHFVLELVQNADDNTYSETEIPALKFVVDSKSIVVLNNEVGFSEKNIRALCDVGKSTKGPHQYGYIGQKGIGFKSVFRISDTPEVHSNGYNIRFDAKCGPSGYILPHWIDKDTCANQDGKKSESPGWMTKIVLPLKDEFHGDKKTSLTARFHDVHPSLLLFLHRLRSITIENDNGIQKMVRKDLSNNIIEINHGHEIDRWLVVKKQMDASKVREDVEMTELAIAFPIAEDSTTITSYKTLPSQNVFAYLPLRSYGFKFIIQGDFEVPSSREDVDGDKAWNQWLREEIPKLFIDALEVFKNHPSFPGLLSISRFFQFVPLEEEILDFFAPVALAIHKYLQGMPCLPTERLKEGKTKKKGNKDSEREPIEYDWMQPCTVVVCDDQEVHAFITPDILRKHLNLNYLVHEVAYNINPALRAKLGVQTLSARHIVDIGHAVFKDLDGNRPNDVKWISQWLYCICRCLESEHNSSADILKEIASMDIFPLSNNRLVNLKDHVVFFPLSVDQTTKSKNKSPKVSYLADLQRDLSVLHPDLLTHLEKVGHSQLEKLLTRLGVKSWTPSDVIHNHILRTFKSDEWMGKSHVVLQSYLAYIFDQRLTSNTVCSMEELKDCCQVLTNKGFFNPSKTPVHFTPKYGYELDLRKELSSINWILIDDSYLEMSTHRNVTTKDWEEFFSALGVCYFIAIERKTIELTKMTVRDSPWSSYEKDWPETADGCYIVEDYCSSELEEFMQMAQKDPNQARIIAENLAKHWTNQYSLCTDYVPVKDTEGRELQKTLSSFLHYLREEDWIPVATSPPTCHVPRSVFSNTEQLRGLLEQHVLYADAKFDDSSFVKDIGLVSSVSAEDVLKHLIKWSSRTRHSGADTCQDSVFITSLSHMKRVYGFLHEQCCSQDIRVKITDAFQKNSLFFIPKDTVKVADRRVQGKFYSIKEVCWNDPAEVTQKLHSSKRYTPKRQILSPHYKESHDFLIPVLRVDPTPHTDEYIEMAAVLADESALPTPPVIESIFEIFAVLGKKCFDERHRPNYEVSDEDLQIDQHMAKYLRGKLQQEAIFPCGERWVTLCDKPIIPDSKQLKKIFDKERNVHFITLGCSPMKSRSRTSKNTRLGEEEKQRSVKVFLRACGIDSLSKIVEEELTPKNVEYQCHEVQQYFHDVVPCIQRYLYAHMEERYKTLKDQSFGEKLAVMKFATVEKLEVVYRLKGLSQVTVGQEIKYGSESISGKALYFYAVKQHSKSIDSLNKAITKLFIDGNFINFENFLSSLSNKLDDGLEDFLEEQEVDALPEGEVEWFIPEPDILLSPETEIPDDLSPPVVRRTARTENDGEMHCWPPRSSVTGAKAAVCQHQPSLPKNELWPQPEAPESMTNDPLKGSRLQSYISTAGRQQSAVDKKVQGSDNHNKEPHPLLGSPRVDSSTQRPVDKSVVVAPASGNLDPDSHAPAETTQYASPDVTSLSVSSPYPSDGTILPGCSPAIQQLSSTPRIDGNSPSVFNPSIHITLEDLKLDKLNTEIEIPLPTNMSLNDSSDKTEIGRIGENIVYDYLKRQEPQENILREIIWMNEDVNSTAPFDIQVTSKPLNVTPGGPEDVTYIEVKSTSTEDKEYFEISIPELTFALEQREHLHLYRVFIAGSNQQIRILRIQNLAEHLERKNVKMFMIV